MTVNMKIQETGRERDGEEKGKKKRKGRGIERGKSKKKGRGR